MENFEVGSIVKGEVTGVESYGIFVKIDDDTNGLIHISEIANKYISNITKYVNVGERIYAKVIDFDSENNRLKLSIKGLNYKEVYLNKKVQESVRGFSPLQENLELWINQALKNLNE